MDGLTFGDDDQRLLKQPQVLPLGVWACWDLPSDILVPVNDVILAYPIIRVHTSRSCVIVTVFLVEVLIPFVYWLIPWFQSRVDGTGRLLVLS